MGAWSELCSPDPMVDIVPPYSRALEFRGLLRPQSQHKCYSGVSKHCVPVWLSAKEWDVWKNKLLEIQQSLWD